MNKIINKIGDIFQNKYGFSEEKSQRIQYTLKATWNELSKFLVYLIIFLLAGKPKEFFLVYFCLISLRIFEGGLHCKKYFTCLLFSFIIISSCIYLPKTLLSLEYLYVIALISILCTLLFAPTLPKVRKLKTRKQYWILKIFALINTLAWLLIIKTNYGADWNTSVLYTIIFSNYQVVFSYFQIRNKK